MKEFKDVEIGDKTIDYNGEKGVVVRKAQRGNSDFDDMIWGWEEEFDGMVDEALEIEGDEYGTFGGFGKVVFAYGYDGAYVP